MAASRRGHDHEGHRPQQRRGHIGAEEQRDDEDGDGRGHHADRVALLYLLHEQLGACLGRAGLLDHADDPGDHRLVRGTFHPHPQSAGAVEGSGEHLIAGQLVHGKRLAGDGGLVHLARPGDHPPVRADPLPGTDDDHVPDLKVGGVHDLLGAVGLQPGGGLGCQVQQPAH
jgi:hypothetical protein